MDQNTSTALPIDHRPDLSSKIADLDLTNIDDEDEVRITN